MSTYTATIRWSRTGDGDFAKGQYSRANSTVTLNLFQGPFSERAAWVSAMDAETSSA